MTSTDPRATGTALWFPESGSAELRAEPVGSPAADEVQVRSTVSLVSSGSEMTVFHGRTAGFEAVDIETVGGRFPFPIKFGYQVVGRVSAAGARSGFAEGDRVFCYFPHQDLFNCWVRSRRDDGVLAGWPLVFPIPDDVPDDRAAFANLAAVALTAVLDVPVRPGELAVVSGLGVVGQCLARILRRTVGRLVLVEPAGSRRAAAADIGADAIVEPEEAAAAIHDLSAGRGADVHFEASGAGAALQRALDTIAVEGTVVAVSFYGSQPVALRLAPQFHVRRPRIVSSHVGLIGSGLQPRWDPRRRMSVVLEELARLDVDRLVSHRIPFDRAPEAYRLIDTGTEEAHGVLLDY